MQPANIADDQVRQNEATFQFGYTKRKLLKLKRLREEPVADNLILECVPQQKKQRSLIHSFQSFGFREYEPTRLRFRRLKEVSQRKNVKNSGQPSSSSSSGKKQQAEAQQVFRDRWKESKFRLVRGIGEEDEVLKKHGNLAAMYDVVTIEEIAKKQEQEENNNNKKSLKQLMEEEGVDLNSPRMQRKQAELQMMRYLPLVQQYLLQQGITYKEVPQNSTQNNEKNNGEIKRFARPSRQKNIPQEKSANVESQEKISSKEDEIHSSVVKEEIQIQNNDLQDLNKKIVHNNGANIVPSDSMEQTIDSEQKNEKNNDLQLENSQNLSEQAEVFEYEYYEPIHEDEYMSDDEDDQDQNNNNDGNQISVGQYYPIILVDEDLDDFWPEYFALSESEEDSEDSNAENYWANEYPEEEEWEEYDEEDPNQDGDDDNNNNINNKNRRDPFDIDEYNMFYDSDDEEERERRMYNRNYYNR